MAYFNTTPRYPNLIYHDPIMTTTNATTDHTLTGTNTSTADDFIAGFPDGHPHDKALYQVAIWLIKLAFPVIVLIGTFGNTMVLVVLKRGAIRTDNLVFFLSVLAVVDTVFLYSSCFKTWLRMISGFELLHVGTWSCKLILFLNQMSLSLSAWLMVIITWQRWYTCAQPFHRCCPTDSSIWGYLGLAGLMLVLLGANSYVLFTAQLHKDRHGYMCAPAEDLDETIGEVFPLIMMVLYSGAPAVLVFVLNGLLVSVLYRSRQALLTNGNASSTSRRDEEVRSRYNHVTAMLVALSACWFLFAMPQTILKHIERYPVTAQQAANNFFLNVMAYVLLYLNHAINFFIYCTLKRSFRREVKRLTKHLGACLTTVTSVTECSSTRRDSLTDIGGGIHYHNQHHHHPQHHPHHPQHHPQHHHYHPHHGCQHSTHRNSHGADSYRPLIVRYNTQGQGEAYTRHAKL